MKLSRNRNYVKFLLNLLLKLIVSQSQLIFLWTGFYMSTVRFDDQAITNLSYGQHNY